jgi:hypothetical protein
MEKRFVLRVGKGRQGTADELCTKSRCFARRAGGKRVYAARDKKSETTATESASNVHSD